MKNNPKNITAEQEYTLALIICGKRQGNIEQAKTEFIMLNRPYVVYAARQYQTSSLFDDLVHEGLLFLYTQIPNYIEKCKVRPIRCCSLYRKAIKGVIFKAWFQWTNPISYKSYADKYYILYQIVEICNKRELTLEEINFFRKKLGRDLSANGLFKIIYSLRQRKSNINSLDILKGEFNDPLQIVLQQEEDKVIKEYIDIGLKGFYTNAPRNKANLKYKELCADIWGSEEEMLNMQEISQTRGINISTAYKIEKRAREKMRLYLRNIYEFREGRKK